MDDQSKLVLAEEVACAIAAIVYSIVVAVIVLVLLNITGLI